MSATTTLWFTIPYHELGQKALDGVYTIRVGLCAADSSYLFQPGKTVEVKEYDKYVGAASYQHDVEFQYIWQGDGFTNYDVYEGQDWKDMIKPYKNTLVHFVKADSDSNPVPLQSINSSSVFMNAYVDQYASKWPGHPDRREYQYFLCGVEVMMDRTGSYELDVLGQTEADFDLCFVAVGKIKALFTAYVPEIKLAVAAHEFGFAIGSGLPEFCGNTGAHTPGFDCLMGGLGGDSYGVPYWKCPDEPVSNAFDGDFDFCQECIGRLNDVDFLVVDY